MDFFAGVLTGESLLPAELLEDAAGESLLPTELLEDAAEESLPAELLGFLIVNKPGLCEKLLPTGDKLRCLYCLEGWDSC